MLSVVSWNVNSVLARLELLLAFIHEYIPDILLLQELKCTEDKFPYHCLEELGYHCVVLGQKAYNGVAIISKFPIELEQIFLLKDDNQSRYIQGFIAKDGGCFRIASIYVPNGQEPYSESFKYKMRFLDALYAQVKDLLNDSTPLILGGDYNIAPDNNDVYDPMKMKDRICFHYLEKQKFRAIKNLGMSDAFRMTNIHDQHFSWWDYRAGGWNKNRGMRIDHILTSPEASDMVSDCRIITSLRGKPKPSDHAPVLLNLLVINENPQLLQEFLISGV